MQSTVGCAPSPDVPDRPATRRGAASPGARIGALARRLWGALPAGVRAALDPAARQAFGARLRLAEVALGPAVETTVVEGQIRGAPGTRLRVAIVGSGQDLRSLARTLFEPTPALGAVDRLSLPAAGRAARRARARADLVLLSLPRLLGALVPPGFEVLPGSVRVSIPVGEGMRLLAEGRGPIGAYRRVLTTGHLRYRILTGPAALDRFHAEFYLPYARARFGAAAALVERSFYDRFEGLAEVLVVSSRERDVAAAVLVRHADRLRLLAVGYAGGDVALMRAGGGAALHAFAIERAARLGHEVLDTGPIRPFLANPVLLHRRDWGARLGPDPWSTRLLAVGGRALTPDVARALEALPAVARTRDGELVGLVPPDPATGEPLPVRAARAWIGRGLVGLRAWRLAGPTRTG